MSKKTKKSFSKKAGQQFKSPYLYLVFLGVIALALVGYIQSPKDEKLPPVPADALYKNSSAPIDERVSDLIDRMSLKEKVGQMSLVDKNSLKKPEDIRKYHLGAMLSGAGAKPADNTAEGWTKMINGYQSEAAQTRLQIPLFYGIDANHGHSNIPGATIFPHAIGLGATGDGGLVAEVAQATADELEATGVNWSFSPSLDAPKDIRWGRVYEAFGDDPAIAGDLGAACVAGVQNMTEPPTQPRVLATAKHYLGTGAQTWGKSDNPNFKIDQGRTEASETLLAREYLPPFKQVVDQGVGSVMVALQKYGDTSIITNRYLITDKLKGELGFKGFVVSDWYGVYERAGNRYNATVKAVNAGLDMAMLPFDYKNFERDVVSAVQRGEIEQSRIDDAVRRILTQKFRLGLFDKSPIVETEASEIGSADNRALARRAVARSAVLLKNDNVLPLNNQQTILLAGSGADNIGRQSGAWTVEWQGIDGNWLPGAKSILAGMQEVEPSATINYEKYANFDGLGLSGKADVGVVVVSEKPYAEGWGDNEAPAISEEDRAALDNMRQYADKVIVVVVSGRPLLFSQAQVDEWDGLVAVWLPGSEGAGVADVLFGKQPFSGKLPIHWPANTSQLPVTSDGTTADGSRLLFERGYSSR